MQKSQIRKAAAAIGWLMLTNAVLGFASASAQVVEVGKTQYQASCAACHGADAKGTVQLAVNLKHTLLT